MKDIVDPLAVLECSKRIIAHVMVQEKDWSVETLVAALRMAAHTLDETRNQNLATHSRAAVLGSILSMFRK